MLTVSLNQETWNNVLMLLAEHPYKLSAPLIQQITQQLQIQVQQGDAPGARINGVNEIHSQ